jgi:NAD(P)-dependent dehydrogenase (short-subunit alcohol dehydrogenase family)
MMRARMRLAGKRAIVTGAASGIGRAAALAFAEAGAAVSVADVDRRVHDTAARIIDAGGRARAVEADVSREKACADLVQDCVSELGGLEVMFANAGIAGNLSPLVELSGEEFRRVLEVNLLGVFYCIKHAALVMLDRGGGSIVCTASVAGLRAGAGPAPYSASKAAVINLVQNAAVQLSGTGVRVNAICPGLVETGMTGPIFEMARAAGKEHKIGQLNPLRRAGRAEEVASVALFLASDDSSYVNGEALVVDGGLAASLPLLPGKLW